MSAGFLRSLLVAALMVAPLAHAGGQPGTGYPKLGSYSAVYGDGTPFLVSSAGNPQTWPMDTAAVALQARWDHVILDISPVTEYRPDILQELRRRNPGVQLIAYAAVWWWANPTPLMGDTTTNFPWKAWRAVRDTRGILYSTSGQPHQYLYNTNLANRDGFGRYVTAEALADTIAAVVVRSGLWQGLFVDGSGSNIWWAQRPGDSIDYVRAGYATPADFNAGYAEGQRVFSQRLRDRLGPGFYLCGNGGSSGERDIYSGWMRENFPYLNGGTWEANMLATPGGDPGYLSDDSLYRSPGLCWLSVPNADQTMDPTSLKHARYALGSASLGEGVADITGSSTDLARGFLPWWLDEYAVDLGTGAASASPGDRGWLGAARGRWYQMVWAGSGADAVSNPDFESSVTDGWWFTHAGSVPGSVTRDTTTFAVGSASARIHLDASGLYDWYATYGTNSSLSLLAGRPYSATFWARASKSRPITVAAAVSGTAYATQLVGLDTAWRHYQVVLVPGTNCTAQLHISVAAADGDVWLDDVHLQAGVTSIYRRDFEHGIVLVNPAQTAMTVPVSGTCRRILGAADPVTNDGSAVTQATVPANDALFLISGDDLPPSAIRDLRASY
jgi:hypothetical protein